MIHVLKLRVKELEAMLLEKEAVLQQVRGWRQRFYFLVGVFACC